MTRNSYSFLEFTAALHRVFSELPAVLCCAHQGFKGKSFMKGGGNVFSVLRNDAKYLNNARQAIYLSLHG